MATGYGFTADGQPVRPYASPDQVPAGAEFRSNAFNTGIAGEQDPGNIASSLNQTSARWNNLTPAQFTPQSTLDSQALRPSMNAESAQDYARVLPGGYTLPTQNGQSQSSWSASNILRMQGQDSE
jgi:hypothetical protein